MRVAAPDFCPFIKGKCKQSKCMMFKSIRGTNPNTGSEIDEYDCAIGLLPMALLEVAKQTRDSGAAIESFRNVVVDIATGRPPTQRPNIVATPHEVIGHKN